MLMAQTTGAWTLAELDRLPDDGNRYELVEGVLFVTPEGDVGDRLRAKTLSAVRSRELSRRTRRRCSSQGTLIIFSRRATGENVLVV